MYIQQKMITPAPTAATANNQQAQTQQMMTWMMPLIFGYFSLNVPAGLALYWAVSNTSGVVLQYFYMGRKFDWKNMLTLNPQPAPAARRARPERKRTARTATRPTATAAPTSPQIRTKQIRTACRRWQPAARGREGNDMADVEASGKTVEEAIEDALAELSETDPEGRVYAREDVEVEVLESRAAAASSASAPNPRACASVPAKTPCRPPPATRRRPPPAKRRREDRSRRRSRRRRRGRETRPRSPPRRSTTCSR